MLTYHLSDMQGCFMGVLALAALERFALINFKFLQKKKNSQVVQNAGFVIFLSQESRMSNFPRD